MEGGWRSPYGSGNLSMRPPARLPGVERGVHAELEIASVAQLADPHSLRTGYRHRLHPGTTLVDADRPSCR